MSADDATVEADDVLVIVAHPYADIVAPLREWMRIGPGPRPFVRPVAARHRRTGASLPLTVIPLRFRNDDESRRLIEEGKIENPWPAPPR